MASAGSHPQGHSPTLPLRREGVTTGNVSCKVPYPNQTLLNSSMPDVQTPRLSIRQSINKYLNSEKTQTTARL